MTYTFEQYLARVDEEVDRLAGLSYHDLVEYPYREAYERGVNPTIVAKRAIRASVTDEEWEPPF